MLHENQTFRSQRESALVLAVRIGTMDELVEGLLADALSGLDVLLSKHAAFEDYCAHRLTDAEVLSEMPADYRQWIADGGKDRDVAIREWREEDASGWAA